MIISPVISAYSEGLDSIDVNTQWETSMSAIVAPIQSIGPTIHLAPLKLHAIKLKRRVKKAENTEETLVLKSSRETGLSAGLVRHLGSCDDCNSFRLSGVTNACQDRRNKQRKLEWIEAAYVACGEACCTSSHRSRRKVTQLMQSQRNMIHQMDARL